MRPGLPQALEALALRAEKEGQPKPVPAHLLLEVAKALYDLLYIGQHGGAWEQRIVREGRAGAGEARDA